MALHTTSSTECREQHFRPGDGCGRDIFVAIGRSVDAAVYVGFSREHCRDGTIGNFQHSPDGCFKDFLAFASVC